MTDVGVPDLQALINRQDLQDQELQPTLDSLSLLLKDSNHKVCARGCIFTVLAQPATQSESMLVQGVSKGHPGAACSTTAVQRGVSQ